MTALYWVVGLVALQRLAELAYARRNTTRLLQRGGIETGRRHYPLLVLIHAAWLLSLVLFVPAGARPNWLLLGLYAALQVARCWTIVSLGEYWTTRVIRVPGAPLIRRGPYRYIRHPNYLIVVLEIALLPLVFGAWAIAAAFTALNAVALAIRLGAEEKALRDTAPDRPNRSR